MSHTNKFTAATELDKLNQETEGKKLQIFLKEEVLNKISFDPDNIIVYDSRNIHFGWRNPLDKEQVRAIFEIFPINGKNYEMKFASSDKNFDTDSPLIVKWENSHSYHHPKVFKIKYESNGLFISITVPYTHFGSHVWYRQFKGAHKGFGRYEMFNDMFLDYFYTQHYSGGYNTCYFLDGAESLKEYENWVITGQFQYENEIN